MNIAHLKSKILDLAVRGKLTEQRPEEGSAEELLARIREEKQRLIAEGKLKKEKPLPDITEDEIPFNIPAGWKWVRLGECGMFISGYTPKTSDIQADGSIPYFKVADMNAVGNEIYLKKTSSFLKRATKKFLKNTIVYPKNGGAVFTNKRRILTEDSVVDLNTGGYYPFSQMDLMYFYYLFLNIDFKKYHKGSALPTLDLNKLKQRIFPLPPLAEQKRIVEKIEAIFKQADIIEEKRLALKTAVRHTKSRVLDLAVRGKLTEQRPEEGSAEELLARIREEKQRLIAGGKMKKEKPLPEITEEEIPFDIPAGWKWCRYMDLFTHSSGKALKQSDTDGIKREYITTSNLYWNRFDLTKVRTMYFKDRELEKCTVKKGDLLLCNGGDVGRAAIWNYDYNICIQNHVSRLRPINPQIQIKYFFYLLWYYKTSGFISGKGIGISSLTVNDILSLAIPLPPLAEQKRIVEKIEQIFGTLDTIEKAVEG